MAGNRALTVMHIGQCRLDSPLLTENSEHWSRNFRVSPAPAIDNGTVRKFYAGNLWQNSRNIKQ